MRTEKGPWRGKKDSWKRDPTVVQDWQLLIRRKYNLVYCAVGTTQQVIFTKREREKTNFLE